MDQEARAAAVDARLARALRAPRVSPDFRRRLRHRIEEESRPLWHGLPDMLHLGGCAVVISTCAATLPYSPAATAAAGVLASLASYIVLTAVRGVLDEA